MRKRILFIVLFAWSGILHAFSQQQANYELANEFQAFGLGGNFTANSLNIWPKLMEQISFGLNFIRLSGRITIL